MHHPTAVLDPEQIPDYVIGCGSRGSLLDLTALGRRYLAQGALRVRLAKGCSRPSTSSSDGFGSGTGDGPVGTTDGVGYSFVGADKWEEIGEARGWLSDLGSLGVNFGECMGEHGQGLAVRQCGGRGEHGVEACISCGCGHLLGDRVVIGEQVALVDTKVSTDGSAGEVEYLEVDGHAPDTAAELEQVDTVVDEVTEELCPGGLLLVGGVPDAGIALPVVPAWSSGRIGAGGEGMTGRALVPPVAGEVPSRGGCDRVGVAHT